MSDESKLPETDEEWQECVDIAHGLLHIESARAYGFVTGGPRCNVERCEEILALGAERGFTPRDGAVEATVRTFIAQSTGD